MNTFINSLYDRMTHNLNQIALASENQLRKAEESYKVSRDIFRELREHMEEYTFDSTEEEIRFFKEVKPLFEKELIYFTEVFYIEADKPVGCRGAQLAYFTHSMEPIQTFFERNRFLYIYYRTGKTDYDEQFFLRKNNRGLPEYTQEMDPHFSTIQSSKLAKILAYEGVNKYLRTAINTLNGKEDEANDAHSPENVWTDSKVALIELAYAIQSRGAINNGKADVKQVISALEEAFHIDLGNYYAVFQQNIRIRKKSRTVYLDQLKEYLERRMDDSDENPKRLS